MLSASCARNLHDRGGVRSVKARPSRYAILASAPGRQSSMINSLLWYLKQHSNDAPLFALDRSDQLFSKAMPPRNAPWRAIVPTLPKASLAAPLVVPNASCLDPVWQGDRPNAGAAALPSKA